MRIELSHHNHFQFGYNGVPFSFRKETHDIWEVSYGPCLRTAGNFKEECISAAKIIGEKSMGRVMVLFSGGVDSEVALRSFVLAGVPVKAAIMRYEDDLNLHDINYALKACQKLGIDHYFFDLKIRDFWEHSLSNYADSVYCISPQLIATMWLIDQVDEYPVIGSGECLLVRRGNSWDLWEKERIAAWYRHFIVRNRSGCPGFFQYTPELMLSYLQDPFVIESLKWLPNDVISNVSIKLPLYQNHFPLETRLKYTGFEKLQSEDWQYRQMLIKKFPDCDAVFKSEINQLKLALSFRT